MKKTKKTAKISLNGVEYDIPEGISLLTNDGMYTVKLDLINYADPLTEDESKGDFKWFNFRHLTKKGFGEEDMALLKASITDSGLLYPPICRWYITKDNTLSLQLLEGERRLRSIRELVEENKKCWSKIDNDYLPAQEVYESIPCRIVVADEKESLRIALSVHDNSIDWGESSKTRIVMSLRSAGCTDDEILDITKKSVAWLREEDHLSTLDEKTFSFYENGKINRSVALRLLKIEDLDNRHKYLEQAYTYAVKDYEENIKEAEVDLDKAEQKEEVAEATLALLEEAGKDAEAIDAAKEKYVEAKVKTEAKKEKKETLKKKGVQTKTKHLASAAKDTVDSETPESALKVLSPVKLKKQQERIEALIVDKGKLEDKIVVSTNILEWLVAVYKGILSGEENIDKVLKRQVQRDKLLSYRNKKTDIIGEDDNKDIEEEDEDMEEDLVESFASLDATLDSIENEFD